MQTAIDMALNNGFTLQRGKFRIVRFINSGGFGITYEAEHTILHTRHAIKEFFVKDFCNRDEDTCRVVVGTVSKVDYVDGLKHMFIEEAKAISSLNHKGIVKVIDVFEENGTAYYVMDYIDGFSLQNLVENGGALSEDKAVGYIKQVCSALEYVHSFRRLHLDLKPGNIMVNRAGDAILIDFGVSKHYDGVDKETRSMLLGASPGYAPIEQMGNDVQTFQPAIDIYALGATLYMLLTGIVPPESTKLANDSSLLLPLPVHISASVRKAVAKAMEVKQKNRPQSIREFMDMLTLQPTRPKPDNNPTPITPDTLTKPIDSKTWFSRHMQHIALSTVLLIVVAGIVLALMGHGSWPGGGTKDSDTVVAPPAIPIHDTIEVTRMEYKNQQGVMTGYYTGTLVDSVMNGEGKFEFIEGGSAEGTFRGNQIVKGSMTTADKYVFVGTFKDEEPDSGVWYDPDMKQYSKVVDGECMTCRKERK